MSQAAETQLFGLYRVLNGPDGRPALLGRGAFGTVMRGRSELTGQEVALKIIHDHLSADERVRRRFRDEAREHRRLKHAGVVQVLDIGETESTLYIAMEYCAGRDLQTWSAEQGPLPAAKALTLLRPIADALVYASGHGLIHRDIKPSNILLVSPPRPGELPEVKLADFGLAKKVWSEGGTAASMASHAGIKGTLQYASPEQVREETLDARSDMFSFGLTLWHLLAGRYPFPELTQDYQFIRERAELASYEPFFPDSWPTPLRALMARLVAAKPTDRFDNFGQVVSAMDECLEQLEGTSEAAAHSEPARLPAAALPVREFFSLNFLENTPIGALFDAKPLAVQEGQTHPHQQLTLLSQELSAELKAEIRESIRRLTAHPHPSLAPVEWRDTRDGEVVIVDVPPGAPLLLDRLRHHQAMTFRESLPWLEQIASALDHAAHLGLPGVETAPAAITVMPDERPGRERLMLPAKLYHQDQHASSASATLTMLSVSSGSSAGPKTPATAFALLAYRMLSARDPKQASLTTPSAYVSIDALSEAGNALLRDALCGSCQPTCLDLLGEIRQAEGLGSRAAAAFSRSSTLPPQPLAPVPPAPVKIASTPVVRPLSVAAPPPPPPAAPTVASTAAAVPPPPQPPIAATPAPPPPLPAQVSPPAQARRKWPAWSKWVALGLPFLLLPAAIALYLLRPKVEAPPPPQPPPASSQTASIPTTVPTPEPPSSTAPVTEAPTAATTPVIEPQEPPPASLPDIAVPRTMFAIIGNVIYNPLNLLSNESVALSAPTLLCGVVERPRGSEGQLQFGIPSNEATLVPLAMAAMSKWVEANGGGAAVRNRFEALARDSSGSEQEAMIECLRQWTMLSPRVQSTTEASHPFARHVRHMQEYYRYAQRAHPPQLWAGLIHMRDQFHQPGLLVLTWKVLDYCKQHPEVITRNLAALDALVDAEMGRNNNSNPDNARFWDEGLGRRTAAQEHGETTFSIQETTPNGSVKNLWSITARPDTGGKSWSAWLSACPPDNHKLPGDVETTARLDFASCVSVTMDGRLLKSPDGRPAP